MRQTARRLRLALVLGWLCLALGATRLEARERDEGKDASSDYVRRAIATLESGEESAVTALVEEAETPLSRSPWCVLHELMMLGRRDLARRWSKASSLPDYAPMDEYRSRIERVRPSREVWDRYLRISRLAGEKKWFEITVHLRKSSLERDPRTVPTVLMHALGGLAFLRVDMPDAAAEHFKAGVEQGQAIHFWPAVRWMLHYWQIVATKTSDDLLLLECLHELGKMADAVGDTRRQALAEVDRGSLLGNLGRYEEARNAFNRVLKDHLADLEPWVRVQTLAHAGLAEAKLGRFADAQKRLLDARDLARSSLAGELSERERHQFEIIVGWTTEMLGSVAMDIGDFPQSALLLQEAIHTLQRLQATKLLTEAYGNLGNLLLLSGDLAGALKLYEQVHAQFAKEGDERGMARAKRNVAEVWRREAEKLGPGPERMHNLAQARRLLEEVLRVQERLKDDASRADTLNELANVLVLVGKPQVGLARHEQALEIARRTGSLEDEVTALVGKASIHDFVGSYEQALRAAYEAERRISPFFDRLPPSQASVARSRLVRLYEAGLWAALALDRPVDAWAFLEGGRAGQRWVSLDGRHAIKEAVIDSRRLAAEHAARLDEAAAEAAYRQARSKRDLKAERDARKRLGAARSARKGVVERIQLEQRIAADLSYGLIGSCEKVQAALATDQAMVLYGRAGPRIAAIVVTSEDLRLADLGSVRDAHALCAGLRYGRDDEAPTKRLEALRRQLVAPLKLSAHVRKLLVSPLACLAYQPPVLLFPDHEVCCIASGTSWLSLQSNTDKPGTGILALGDPDYGPPPAGFEDLPKTRSGNLMPLPGTRVEAKAVGDEVLLGPEATETNLRAHLLHRDGESGHRRRALHLACHGLVNPLRPSYSGLAMTPSKEDDGLLTALEIYQMQVPADLVVLSACESARGTLIRAEGIVGLTTAFLVAGAKGVIASLWKVDDDATRELMIEFHKRWRPGGEAGGTSAAEALRAAQLHVRDYAKAHGGEHAEWARPHYWAAWQIWGAAD